MSPINQPRNPMTGCSGVQLHSMPAGESQFSDARYGCVTFRGDQVFWNTLTDSSNDNGVYSLCYARYKETACANCTEGRYAPEPTSGSSGALSCYSCPSGKYLPREGARSLDSCLSCGVGKKSFEVNGAISARMWWNRTRSPALMTYLSVFLFSLSR